MPVTVGGTSITFNDSTVQTTAAGAPTTTQVLNATAGASVGAVGTYAFLSLLNTNAVAGSTYAASNLRYSDAGSYQSAGTPSGTWRALGSNVPGGSGWATLYLRIS